MTLIILPGNGAHNRDWMEQAAQACRKRFPDQYLQYYDHWQSEDGMIDLDRELAKLTAAIGSAEADTVLAKSAGAMLTVYGSYLDQLRPKRCVLVGLPSRWFAKHGFNYQPWLKNFTAPATVIQNDRDPIATHGEIKEELDRLGKDNIKLIKTAGNDHDYSDFDLISRYLS